MKTKLFYIALSLLALISCDAHRTIDMEEPSNKVSFGKFTDARDGYTYKTVTINGQTWMAENLRYCPDEPLDNPNITSRTIPFYYVYKSYDEPDTKKNLRKYGIIYNYYAAREAVPSGWRLPEASDFYALIDAVEKMGSWDSGGYSTLLKMMSPNSVSEMDKGYVYLNISGFNGVYCRSITSWNDFYSAEQLEYWTGEIGAYSFCISGRRSYYSEYSSKVSRNADEAYPVRCIKE